ncbi:MAG: HAD family hydrolase [Acidimicrobiia bacterium]|nr:HAD family hydrolase [Acidimicrobiia bacterium]
MIVRVGKTAFDVDMIVFDKDGTLIDLNAAWAPAARIWIETSADGDPTTMNALEAELGVDDDGQLLDGGSLASEAVGQITARTRAVLLSNGVDESAAEQRMKAAQAGIDQMTIDVRPLGPVRMIMERLAHAGLILTIASSDNASQIHADLVQLGISAVISAVAAGDGPWPPKPHPGGIIALADQFEVDPHRLLMVGDSLTDVAAARNAGAAGVVGVARADGTCVIAPMVDAVVRTIGELIVAV